MAVRTEIPESLEAASVAGRGFSFDSIHEINERCLELLMYAARSERIAPFNLLFPIRQEFLRMTPALRRCAAARAFLLLDFEFANVEWWTAVQQFPDKRFRGAAWRNPFPRRSAIPLTRATLMLAWQLIRTDARMASVTLGTANKVAEIIGNLQLTELDSIADRRHRHLEPRWGDRPAVWRSLLSSALAPQSAATKRIDAYGLQLLAGDLMPNGKIPCRPDACRRHTASPLSEP